MVAMVPSMSRSCPGERYLRVLDGTILWLSDAGEFAGCDFYPVPWGEPDPGKRGRKRVYSERQADVKRNFRRRKQKSRGC